jgi:hypothetical protein
VALPVRDLTLPTVLVGQHNGELPDELLVTVPGQQGGAAARLVQPAARAWRALCAVALAEGHLLKTAAPFSSYRPFAEQERIFRERYTTTVLPGRPSKEWGDQTWFQKPGTDPAAVPGKSNHGWGLALDTGEESDPATGTESIDDNTLAWLVDNEERFGFSHEIQSERWHIRYFAGDDVPPDIFAFEQSSDGSVGFDLSDLQEDDMFTFGTEGQPVFFVAGGKAVGLNEASDLETIRTALAPAPLPHFALDDDTYAQFLNVFRDGQ